MCPVSGNVNGSVSPALLGLLLVGSPIRTASRDSFKESALVMAEEAVFLPIRTYTFLWSGQWKSIPQSRDRKFENRLPDWPLNQWSTSLRIHYELTSLYHLERFESCILYPRHKNYTQYTEPFVQPDTPSRNWSLWIYRKGISGMGNLKFGHIFLGRHRLNGKLNFLWRFILKGQFHLLFILNNIQTMQDGWIEHVRWHLGLQALYIFMRNNFLQLLNDFRYLRIINFN